MTTIIHGIDSSNSSAVKAVKVDSHVGGVVVTDHVHHEVHEGEMFVASYVVPHGSEVANDASQDILFVTAANMAHIAIEISVGGDAEVLVYEGTTTSANGTGLAEINMNRTSTATAVETAFHTPTVTVVGTLLVHSFIAGGAGPVAGGGATRSNTEWLFASATKYLIRVTNRSGAAIQMSVVLEWYSET